MTERKKVCMLCGKPSEESICETCKNKVQGEALKKKKQMGKGVSIGSEVEKDKVVKKHGKH